MYYFPRTHHIFISHPKPTSKTEDTVSMISPRKLMAMARKWQKMAGIGKRKKISLPKSCNTSRLADKGHFVVYSMDKRRFMVPLAYLSSNIFVELLRMSEEVFGLPKDGPITLPFDAASMEYLVSMVQRKVSVEFEKALLVSLANTTITTTFCCETASHYSWLVMDKIQEAIDF